MTYWERELYWYGYWDYIEGRKWEYQDKSNQEYYIRGRIWAMFDVFPLEEYIEQFLNGRIMCCHPKNNAQIPEVCNV